MKCSGKILKSVCLFSAILLIFACSGVAVNAGGSSPVVLEEENSFFNYSRVTGDSVIFCEMLTLKNTGDTACSFQITGIYTKDYNSGLITKERIPGSVNVTGTENVFTIKPHETLTGIDVYFVAPHGSGWTKTDRLLPEIEITALDADSSINENTGVSVKTIDGWFDGDSSDYAPPDSEIYQAIALDSENSSPFEIIQSYICVTTWVAFPAVIIVAIVFTLRKKKLNNKQKSFKEEERDL